MNQKGFIPIIFIVVGAVVIASAAFGVVKYKDELSQLPAAVIDFLIGSGEPAKSSEDIEAGPPESEDFSEKTEKAIEKEEKKEEKKGKRIVKGPRTGPKEEKLEKQIEEIQEQEQEIEVIETDVLTISNINVDINRVPTDPVVITWITNKESNTSLEYGLSPGSYDWLLHNSISKETDAGFLHAIYLYAEFNRVHHYRVSSVDSDGNRAESENMTFRKIYFPFNVACNSPNLPVITSHRDKESLGADADSNQGMEGMQIELVGTASPDGVIFTKVNSVWYETPIDDVGDWEQKDVTLEQGKNEIYIKVRNVLNCESDIILTLYLDSELPEITIEITDHVGNDFTVNWSASEDNCIFDVGYRIKSGREWGDWIYPEWGNEVEQGSRIFIGAENGTYSFKITATDPAGNEGDPAELEIDIP